MVNSKDILTRLQNGEKAEDIANELINALNDANDTYNKEVAESEAKAKKVADMQDILDLLHDFCIEYYCDNTEDINEVEAAFNEFTAEKVIEIVEEAGETVALLEEHLKDIEKMFADNPFFPTKKPEVEIKVDKTDADFVIKSFLKSIGL